jgi:hypothetical protein
MRFAMKSDCAQTEHLTAASRAEENGINYANIIRAYIAHVLSHEGTHFIWFDRDIEALSLSNAETAELVRLRDEVDAA